MPLLPWSPSWRASGDIIVLSGEMGAGKTAFAQGFGRALGVTDRITSPTFTLVHSYPVDSGPRAGKVTLHHADLYRLERTAEVSDLALRELAEFAGIVLVEWGDVVDLFGDHLVLHLEPVLDDDGRRRQRRCSHSTGHGASRSARSDRAGRAAGNA